MQLCDAHDIPLLFLCNTPGNMVGLSTTDGAGPALLPILPCRRQCERADLYRHHSQRIPSWRNGHGGRQLPRLSFTI